MEEIDKKFVGKSVKILSDWNGQVHGSSKPSLKGKVFKIMNTHIDFDDVTFFLEGYECGHSGVGIDDVEFVKVGDSK